MSGLASLQHIVVAEDHLVNLQILRKQLDYPQLLDKCSFHTNGQEAIDRVRAILKDNEKSHHGQPISLVILDSQMPLKTGIQVMKEVRGIYAMHNSQGMLTLRPPEFVF